MTTSWTGVWFIYVFLIQIYRHPVRKSAQQFNLLHWYYWSFTFWYMGWTWTDCLVPEAGWLSGDVFFCTFSFVSSYLNVWGSGSCRADQVSGSQSASDRQGLHHPRQRDEIRLITLNTGASKLAGRRPGPSATFVPRTRVITYCMGFSALDDWYCVNISYQCERS